MTGGRLDWPLTGTLTAAMVCSTVLAYAFGVLGPFLTADLDLSRTQLGALTTVLYAVGAGLSPSSGAAVDRLGGRVALLALFAASGAAAVGGALAPGYGLLLVAAGVGGLAVALGNPSTNALLAVHVDPRRQGVATGVKQSGVQLGAFLAGAVLPLASDAVGWRGALAGSAALSVGGAVATAVTVPGSAARAARNAPPAGPEGATAAAAAVNPDPSGAPLLADRDVTQLAIYALLMGIGVGAVGAYLPLYAVERLGLSTTAAGLAAGLIGLAGVVARIVWGRAADRRPAAGTAALGALAGGSVLAVVLVAAAEAGWAGLVWPAAVLFGATAVAWNSVGMLAVVRGVDAARSGRASGRVLLGFYLGFVISPTAFGRVVSRSARRQRPP
jgi:MFS family permease